MPVPYANPTRVELEELVQLNRAAADLRLSASRVYGQTGGTFLSALRGRGMEYDESRPYLPGDDARYLDWRVTARSGRPHTKIFREERERPVFVWLDLRASMRFATRGAYKAVLAARAAALIAWAAYRHGDRLGAVIFAENTHQEFRPQRGRPAVLQLLYCLARHPVWEQRLPPASGTDTADRSLLRLARLVHSGSLLFLLSDFRGLDLLPGSRLGRLGRHSDAVLFHFWDPIERELPAPGGYRMGDGRHLLELDVSADAAVAAEYRHRWQRRHAQLQRIAQGSHVQLLECSTMTDPLFVLRHELTRKVKRSAHL